MRHPILTLTLAALTFGAAAADNDAYQVKAAERRDPFSFAATMPEKEIVIGDPPPRIDTDLKAARRKLDVLLPQAELALLEGDATHALSSSDEGLAALRGLSIEDRAALVRERDQLLRVSKAAQRALQRNAAETDFRSLNISVTGLLLCGRQSEAIVNGKLLRPGDFTPVPNSDETPLVREIRPDGVVVRFHGFLIEVDFRK